MSDKDITITPIRDQSGTVTGWDLSYGGKKGNKPSNYPEVVLTKDSGNHEFMITIKDSKGITFAPGTDRPKDADNALWIAEGASSPTAKGINSQIENAKLHNNTQLVFKDLNVGKDMTLAYRLNFTGAPPLDPIIKNGGGTGPGGPIAFYSAGAVLLVALIAFLIWRGKKKQPDLDPGTD